MVGYNTQQLDMNNLPSAMAPMVIVLMLSPEQELLAATARPMVEIPLTPRQVDIVHFRFLDVGHQWVSFKRPEAPFKGNVLVIPGDRMGEALDILESAVDITSDWASDPGGRAEHISTVKLYEKVRDARAREA